MLKCLNSSPCASRMIARAAEAVYTARRCSYQPIASASSVSDAHSRANVRVAGASSSGGSWYWSKPIVSPLCVRGQETKGLATQAPGQADERKQSAAQPPPAAGLDGGQRVGAPPRPATLGLGCERLALALPQLGLASIQRRLELPRVVLADLERAAGVSQARAQPLELRAVRLVGCRRRAARRRSRSRGAPPRLGALERSSRRLRAMAVRCLVPGVEHVAPPVFEDPAVTREEVVLETAGGALAARVLHASAGCAEHRLAALPDAPRQRGVHEVPRE